MLPSEFWAKYGAPTVIRAVLTPGGPHTILADPDRYIIVFLPGGGGGDYMVAPDLDRSITMGSFTVAVTDQPVIYTHALHGAWVNIGWVLTQGTPAPEQTVTYVVGLMPPDGIPKGVSRGKAKVGG